MTLLKPETPESVEQPKISKLFISVNETKDNINSTKHSITWKIDPDYNRLFDNISKGIIGENKIRFTLQTVLAGIQSRLVFQLYLNLPDNTDPEVDSYYFIGTIALFESRCGPKREKASLGITNRINTAKF